MYRAFVYNKRSLLQPVRLWRTVFHLAISFHAQQSAEFYCLKKRFELFKNCIVSLNEIFL